MYGASTKECTYYNTYVYCVLGRRLSKDACVSEGGITRWAELGVGGGTRWM